jgi:hypothetical protein
MAVESSTLGNGYSGDEEGEELDGLHGDFVVWI